MRFVNHHGRGNSVHNHHQHIRRKTAPVRHYASSNDLQLLRLRSGLRPSWTWGFNQVVADPQFSFGILCSATTVMRSPCYIAGPLITITSNCIAFRELLTIWLHRYKSRAYMIPIFCPYPMNTWIINNLYEQKKSVGVSHKLISWIKRTRNPLTQRRRLLCASTAIITLLLFILLAINPIYENCKLEEQLECFELNRHLIHTYTNDGLQQKPIFENYLKYTKKKIRIDIEENR